MRYKTRSAQAPGTPGWHPCSAETKAEMEPMRPLEDVLTPAEFGIVRAGNGEKKRELLESMPPDKMEDMLIAMPRPQRQQLFGPAPSTMSAARSCC